MNIRVCLAFLVGLTWSAGAHALSLWHKDLTMAGQGYCIASFGLESADASVEDLRIGIAFLDPARKVVARGELLVSERFGGSMADRFQSTFIESQEICRDDLQVLILQASAVIDGRRVDLLRAKRLEVRNFRPFPVRLSQ